MSGIGGNCSLYITDFSNSMPVHPYIKCQPVDLVSVVVETDSCSFHNGLAYWEAKNDLATDNDGHQSGAERLKHHFALVRRQTCPKSVRI